MNGGMDRVNRDGSVPWGLYLPSTVPGTTVPGYTIPPLRGSHYVEISMMGDHPALSDECDSTSSSSERIKPNFLSL